MALSPKVLRGACRTPAWAEATLEHAAPCLYTWRQRQAEWHGHSHLCPHPCMRQSRDQAGDGLFQQSQLGQEMWGAGLQPLAEAPGAVTGAGQDGEQSCWLFQSLHCTGPINQMGRCSKLIMVGLSGFLAGIMPMPSNLASSHCHFQGL